jgi:hypothetical protein
MFATPMKMYSGTSATNAIIGSVTRYGRVNAPRTSRTNVLAAKLTARPCRRGD